MHATVQNREMALRNIQEASQKREFLGFSMEIDTPRSTKTKINLTIAAYEAFADSTRTCSAGPRLGSPSGLSSDRSGRGCLAAERPGTGLSRALEAVPQLGAKWA